MAARPEVPAGPVPPARRHLAGRRDPRRLRRPRPKAAPGRGAARRLHRRRAARGRARPARPPRRREVHRRAARRATTNGGRRGWDAEPCWTRRSPRHPAARERRRLVGDLLTGPFQPLRARGRGRRRVLHSTRPGPVGDQQARQGTCSATTRSCCCWTSWCSGWPATSATRPGSAARRRRSPSSSSRPSTSGPRRSSASSRASGTCGTWSARTRRGAVVTSLFDTLKYWDGRFDRSRLDDRNLPAIVHERLLKPKDDAARAAARRGVRPRPPASGPRRGKSCSTSTASKADREAFRAHLPVQPRVPARHGRHLRRLAARADRAQAHAAAPGRLPGHPAGRPAHAASARSSTCSPAAPTGRSPTSSATSSTRRSGSTPTRSGPALLRAHGLTEEQVGGLEPQHAFRADDLVVKTLLLAALVPNVPALSGLTASRLAALNHGSIVTMLPNQERAQVAKTLRDLAGQFGEFRLSGTTTTRGWTWPSSASTPSGILRQTRHVDDDAARRRVIKDLLWEELDVADSGELVTAVGIVWRGTAAPGRTRLRQRQGRGRLPWRQFEPSDPGAIRVIMDYPFDEGTHSPAEDVSRVARAARPARRHHDARLAAALPVRRTAGRPSRPHRDQLPAPAGSAGGHPQPDGGGPAPRQTQLDSRRGALTARLREAIKRAYGVTSPEDEDLGARADTHVLSLDAGVEPRPQVGQGIGTALRGLCYHLLGPSLSPSIRTSTRTAAGRQLKPAELTTVLRAVEQAAQDKVGRYEPPARHPDAQEDRQPAEARGHARGGVRPAAMTGSSCSTGGSAGRSEVAVTQLRGWVEEEQPGLPESVQNLVIACYAIQADKAWARPAARHGPAGAHGDPSGPRAAQPGAADPGASSRTASRRAEGIFGVARQPVRSNRASQRDRARCPPAGERTAHGGRDADRGAGSARGDVGPGRRIPSVRDRACPFQPAHHACRNHRRHGTIRALAAADLPRENAIYHAHLDRPGG